MNMVISQETLLAIVNSIARTHGPDIAHDVAVVLLRRRSPIEKPLHWARSYAAGLARREKNSWRQIKLVSFTDTGFNIQQRLENLPNGTFIAQPRKTSGHTGRPSWFERAGKSDDDAAVK